MYYLFWSATLKTLLEREGMHAAGKFIKWVMLAWALNLFYFLFYIYIF